MKWRNATQYIFGHESPFKVNLEGHYCAHHVLWFRALCYEETIFS